MKRTADIPYGQTPTNEEHRFISIADSNHIRVSGGANYSLTV